METTRDLAENISRSFKTEFNGPFPYADCRRLISEAGKQYENFIPDLDTYFFDVASPCMGVKKLLKRPYRWLQELRQHLQKSFFVRYPDYEPLEAMIKAEDTPDLHKKLATCEALRGKLIQLLFQLMQEQSSHNALQSRSLETVTARHD